MKIGIIGGGSIGLLFASYLRNVFSVTVYTRTYEQAKEIIENGIILLNGIKQMRIPVHALPVDEWPGDEDLTIVAVKQYQLDEVIKKINNVDHSNKNFLFLQNGMGHLKLLSKLKAKNILVGSITHGAYKENANTVRHNGVGVVNLAVYHGDQSFLHYLESMLPTTFPATHHQDYYEMLLNKLIVNAVINPLTAILQVTNGELIKNPYYFKALNELFSEIAYILNLKKPEDELQKIINICQNTAENRSSMLKDIEGGRKTEVDSILGFLLEEAEKQEKKVPLVSSLNFLVKGKEIKREE
jgi:2-dehydropantoate 2-reductase